MQFTETSLPGVTIIDIERFGDERGSFARSFCVDEGVCCGDRLNWQFVAGVRCKRLDERSDPALALTSSFFVSFVRLFVASNRQPTYVADPHFLAGLARPDGGESQSKRV